MDIKSVYKDDDLLVVDKPAGMAVFPEGNIIEKTLIDHLLEKFTSLKMAGLPPRHGIVHRLDKDTSGLLLVAKNNKSLEFFQKQFKNGAVIKKYLALVVGNIKGKDGNIETFIGRSPKRGIKQKVYLPAGRLSRGKRKAITKYKVIKNFADYTLLEILPKTGRKHQIRTHLAYLSHPIAGDKLYGFKNQKRPEGLKRQFLHASYLKITLPSGKIKEFSSPLPKDLKLVLSKLEGL